MRVWLRNPAYFLLLKALLHQICKKKQKNRPERPAKIPQNPQNARKNPQIQKTGCFAVFTHSS